MKPMQASDPLKLPLIVNTVTTRMWLERHTKAHLERLLEEKWGQVAKIRVGHSGSLLFLNAHSSVRLSFLNKLTGTVIQDVFANRRTFEPHQDYLNALRSGNFEPYIVGKFDEKQKAELSAEIYALAKTCVGLLETLPLPHVKKASVNADAPPPAAVPAVATPAPASAPVPAPIPLPIAANAGEEGKIPLSQRELSELDKLKGRIAAATAAASEQNVGFLIQKLKDKSKLLGSEIEALAATRSSTSVLHDSLLKQKHQDVILDGLMLAQERKRELDKQAGKVSPLIIIPEEPVAVPEAVPTIAAPQLPLPVQSVPSGGRVAGLMARLRRHVAAFALGFAGVATGVVMAVNMTGTPPPPSPAPQLAPAFKAVAAPAAQALPTALPAAAEVKNTAPEAVAPPALANPEPLPEVAVTAKTKVTKDWNAARAPIVAAPVKVAGISFTYVTNDTLGKMCSEMRARNIETWACEQQP